MRPLTEHHVEVQLVAEVLPQLQRVLVELGIALDHVVRAHDGGYAHNSGVSMALGYVPKEHVNAEGPWRIELLGERLPARVQHAPIWDANAERMRG